MSACLYVILSLVLFYKFNLLEVCRGPRDDLECCQSMPSAATVADRTNIEQHSDKDGPLPAGLPCVFLQRQPCVPNLKLRSIL